MRSVFSLVIVAAWLVLARVPSAAAASATLDSVREAGKLNCGVISDLDDWSEADTHGNLSALGGDFCRAVAAEVLGDAKKVSFFVLQDEPGGLAAVRDRKVDVLFGATPNPVIGDVFSLRFGPPIFFDGQGFLVAKDSGINNLTDLSKRHVCFINASPAERFLYDALEPMLNEREERFPYSERGEMEVALVNGHCDAITGDISWMANARASFHAQVARFTVLPETISLDPFSPTYRSDDPHWASLIDWTVWVLLQAEAHGVTQANAASLHDSADPVVQRLTGQLPWIAKGLGLSDDAFLHAILAVGNYGEIYDRDVGAKSKLDLPRGRNTLATKGGLMWALPIEPLQ